MVTLGAGLPERFFDTRRAVHLVAARVLGAARYQSVGKMGLVVVDGGIATPEFGGHRLALVDGLLHVNGSQHPLTTLGEACALAGVDPSADLPPALNTAGDAATEVAVDRQAFDALIGWYALCQSALESLADVMSTDENPTTIQLWPEHFDVALEAGSDSTRATYGGSPGDAYFSEPYLYVGPFQARNGEFWNAEFGAAMTRSELHPGVDPLSFYLEARRFLAED